MRHDFQAVWFKAHHRRGKGHFIANFSKPGGVSIFQMGHIVSYFFSRFFSVTKLAVDEPVANS